MKQHTTNQLKTCETYAISYKSCHRCSYTELQLLPRILLDNLRKFARKKSAKMVKNDTEDIVKSAEKFWGGKEKGLSWEEADREIFSWARKKFGDMRKYK